MVFLKHPGKGVCLHSCSQGQEGCSWGEADSDLGWLLHFHDGGGSGGGSEWALCALM